MPSLGDRTPALSAEKVSHASVEDPGENFRVVTLRCVALRRPAFVLRCSEERIKWTPATRLQGDSGGGGDLGRGERRAAVWRLGRWDDQ